MHKLIVVRTAVSFFLAISYMLYRHAISIMLVGCEKWFKDKYSVACLMEIGALHTQLQGSLKRARP